MIHPNKEIMEKAIALAKEKKAVASIIVKDGEIIAQGVTLFLLRSSLLDMLKSTLLNLLVKNLVLLILAGVGFIPLMSLVLCVLLLAFGLSLRVLFMVRILKIETIITLKEFLLGAGMFLRTELLK